MTAITKHFFYFWATHFATKTKRINKTFFNLIREKLKKYKPSNINHHKQNRGGIIKYPRLMKYGLFAFDVRWFFFLLSLWFLGMYTYYNNSNFILIASSISIVQKTRSIQRTQTPPRLWPLTLSCDLDLKSRPKRLMSLDVAYCIVPWYQVWCPWVSFCDIWPLVHFLWLLTFACDFHRPSRSFSFLSLDGQYIVVYWFQVRSL